MLFEMQNLPQEFIIYVENYWQEHRYISKLIKKNNKVQLSFNLDNMLNYYIEEDTTENLEEKLNDIIHKCSQLLKKAIGTDECISYLESLESEYQLFMESYGVDLDNRTYDEEFYAFIHGIN
jgi:hypothetical protein